MKQIAAAYVKAKREFGPALKNSVNPHLKNKYADLGACLEAVEDALLNNGIALMQETSEDATGVTVETIFLHESGERINCGKLHVPAVKQDPQGYGSALTYARRYSLITACGIAQEDDDGNAASRAPKKAIEPEPQKLTESQVSEIAVLVSETGTDVSALLKWISNAAKIEVTALNQAPAEAYSHIIKKLKQKANA